LTALRTTGEPVFDLFLAVGAAVGDIIGSSLELKSLSIFSHGFFIIAVMGIDLRQQIVI
jgi:hypothetical protein